MPPIRDRTRPEGIPAGGAVAGLLFRFYVDEVSWWSFQEREQRIIAKTARAFAHGLRVAGFLPGKG